MNLSFLSVAALLIAWSSDLTPDDLENAFQNLKQAEASKDAAQVKKLAVETCTLARQIIAAPAPEDASQKEAWTQRVAYARDVQLHAEYAIYSTALQGPAAATIELISALEEINPKSRYLDEGYSRYFLALNQTGAGAKVPSIAEKAIVNFPENEDLLLVLTETCMNRKQCDKTLEYAERLLAVLSRHPRPEGVQAADWERKRSAALGRGHFIAGLMHYEKTQYFEADKDLRAALPFAKGNEAMTASTLFHLGVANYQLGTMTRNKAMVLEAAKFSEQAAAIKGPLAMQAWRNAQAMRAEATKLR